MDNFVDEVLKTIAYYDMNDSVFIRYDGDKPEFFVSCNDVHWWAVSDAIEITPENLEELKECMDYNGIEGPTLFCCREYGMRPQGAYYPYLEQNMWLAFDNCGPLRQNGMFNPDIQKFNEETYTYNLEHYANEMFEYLTYPYYNEHYKKIITKKEDYDE